MQGFCLVGYACSFQACRHVHPFLFYTKQCEGFAFYKSMRHWQDAGFHLVWGEQGEHFWPVSHKVSPVPYLSATPITIPFPFLILCSTLSSFPNPLLSSPPCLICTVLPARFVVCQTKWLFM